MLLQNCPIWPINHFCLFLRGHGCNNVISDLSFLTTINTSINVYRRKDFNKYPTLEKQRNFPRNFQVKLIMKDARQYHWPTTQHWSSSFQNRFVPVVCVCVALCVLLWLYKGRRRNCMNLPPGLLSWMTPRHTCKPVTKTFRTRPVKKLWIANLVYLMVENNATSWGEHALFLCTEI